MKVIMLMGRGTEGTGNTRITIELERYIRNAGHDVKTITSVDKAWGRHLSQVNDFIPFKFATGAYSDGNDYDLCIITSVPPKVKKSAKIKADTNLLKQFEETQNLIYDGFTDTLYNLKNNGTRIVYLQVDHKIHSISRNYYALEEYMRDFFAVLDRIVVHKLENDFCKKFIEKKVKPLGCINFDIVEQLAISCDYDEVAKIITPHEKIDKSCYFIGRSATWKGWTDFRELHENYLKDKGYVGVIEGIELSINAKDNLYLKEGNKYTDPRPDNICRIGKAIDEKESVEYLVDNVDEFRYRSVFVYGPFTRNEALNRVAKAKFGIFFSFLGEQYGGPLENTFLEIVAAGTVPVIKKELWKAADFNDDKFTNYSPRDVGIVVYDAEHPEKCVNLLEKLNSDDTLYNEYLANAQRFCRKQFDRKLIMGRLFDRCNIANNDKPIVAVSRIQKDINNGANSSSNDVNVTSNVTTENDILSVNNNDIEDKNTFSSEVNEFSKDNEIMKSYVEKIIDDKLSSVTNEMKSSFDASIDSLKQLIISMNK